MGFKTDTGSTFYRTIYVSGNFHFAYFPILTSKLSILISYKIMQHHKVAKTESRMGEIKYLEFFMSVLWLACSIDARENISTNEQILNTGLLSLNFCQLINKLI